MRIGVSKLVNFSILPFSRCTTCCRCEASLRHATVELTSLSFWQTQSLNSVSPVAVVWLLVTSMSKLPRVDFISLKCSRLTMGLAVAVAEFDIWTTLFCLMSLNLLSLYLHDMLVMWGVVV